MSMPASQRCRLQGSRGEKGDGKVWVGGSTMYISDHGLITCGDSSGPLPNASCFTCKYPRSSSVKKGSGGFILVMYLALKL